jgi:hypothetical protein
MPHVPYHLRAANRYCDGPTPEELALIAPTERRHGLSDETIGRLMLY